MRILIADDDPKIRELAVRSLSDRETEVLAVSSGEEALSRLRSDEIDCLVTDIKMGGMNGIDLIRTAKEIRPGMPAIVMTAFATIETAVEAMKAGARDYISKPFMPDEIRLTVGKAIEELRIREENERLRELVERRYGVDGIVGDSPGIRRVIEMVSRVARSTSTVLITGESGTGKELVARAVHLRSDRSSGPFMAVDCAAIPETLLESELFGHERGAFTGAHRARKGLFEAADGGTILLDEIAEVSTGIQVKLLRVLQERIFTRIGATRPTQVDVRVVAATNRDLERLVKEGRFREDLYFRLNVIPIHIPPLRERRTDIPVLAKYLLGRIGEREGRKGLRFSPEAMRILEAYDWPGNVRELENLVERLVALAVNETIHPADLPENLIGPGKGRRETDKGGLRERVRRFEEAIILEALAEAGGNRNRAASKLGISRQSLQYKLGRMKKVSKIRA